MSQPADTSPRSEGEDVAKPDTQPANHQSAPGWSAYGIPTINVLSTAISRGKPPSDPQTRADFCFDRLLSFLPNDELKLLRVYRALGVPSASLRKWASKGRKWMGEKVLARLEQRKDVAPTEYQFALDHPYVWGLGSGDAWARAGQAYDRKLKDEPLSLPEKKKNKKAAKKVVVKKEDIPGTTAKEASTSQPELASKSSRKRNRKAPNSTKEVSGVHCRHTRFINKKAAGLGPSPLGKFSSR
ncbi:hypothetical protein LX32DRAFT_375971 [Colletotrichum zoysiae]|uniref:Uncharacterized protein n=1 Tax=Colletotrichum zoysiae TaxID=1216348 RepID=A0AAD9HJL4_9PEZI|nr:hypothetical protein LX32DRAFT_375971 [Colletotrichum zoysiae]